MRVAFDWGPLLDPPTGVARYTQELGDALERMGVDVARYAVSLRGADVEGVARVRAPARLVQSCWHLAERPVLKVTRTADVVHATNFVLPALDRTPGVVTVHDLSYLRDDVFPGGERLRKLVPWSLKRAARVIAPTAAVADEIAERYSYPRERITATHEGVANLFFGATPLADAALSGMGISRPFALAVGTLEPRKNLRRLLEAWGRSDLERRGWSLVLAGPKGWGPELPETPGVVLTGRVEDRTLPGLMAAADLFCYPSLYEGFGLPPLEAMATGAACLVGGYGAAEEVLGDAAELVPPADVDAWADALRRLGNDEGARKRLSVKGRARAADFSWERTARRTLEVYEAARSTP